MDQPTTQPEKQTKKFYKKWWFWLLIAVIAAVLFVPYIRDPAQCAVCAPPPAYCPPCPTFYHSLAGYLIDLF